MGEYLDFGEFDDFDDDGISPEEWDPLYADWLAELPPIAPLPPGPLNPVRLGSVTYHEVVAEGMVIFGACLPRGMSRHIAICKYETTGPLYIRVWGNYLDEGFVPVAHIEAAIKRAKGHLGADFSVPEKKGKE